MKKYILYIILILFINSCSTIMNGRYEDVFVHSNIENSIIYVDNEKLGPAPATLRLKRGEIFHIEIRKEGYQSYHIVTRNYITDWFWGNLFFGSFIGMGIDFISGNAYETYPIYINAQLSKEEARSQIIDLDNINRIYLSDENGQKIGEIKLVR